MKRGRKALKDRAAIKTKLVKLRVTQAEHDQVAAMAAQRGMTVTDMVRSFLFKDGEDENKVQVAKEPCVLGGGQALSTV